MAWAERRKSAKKPFLMVQKGESTEKYAVLRNGVKMKLAIHLISNYVGRDYWVVIRLADHCAG
jgi:hypothetical protein